MTGTLLDISGSSVLWIVSEASKEHSDQKMYSEEFNNTANKIFWAVFATVVAAGIIYAASVGNLKPSETFIVGVLCALVIGGLAYLDIHPAFHHPRE
jgi:TRAP-type C4-dicarboxylate transport system permease large subunit